MVLFAVLLALPTAVALCACAVGEWRAREEDARIAIEDALRTVHYRSLRARIRHLSTYPGAYPAGPSKEESCSL
jgi:hypothetical protein